MSIAAVLPNLRGKKPTNQQIADMMLEADQRRRRALREGDAVLAAELDAEVAALAKHLS